MPDDRRHHARPAITLTRRRFLGAAAGSAALLAMPHGAFAATSAGLDAAVAKSSLVYVSPLLGDGRESACHGEVWFVADGPDLASVNTAVVFRNDRKTIAIRYCGREVVDEKGARQFIAGFGWVPPTANWYHDGFFWVRVNEVAAETVSMRSTSPGDSWISFST